MSHINPTIPISEEDLAALRERLGLDQPLPIQHFAWLAAALSGDFGYSIQRGGVPVLPLVLSRVGPTVLLMFTAMLIAIVGHFHRDHR
jgi:ABC-type dipeptide/oligopeptide/nickel transport systems, permease components